VIDILVKRDFKNVKEYHIPLIYYTNWINVRDGCIEKIQSIGRFSDIEDSVLRIV
jgi:hypothetical protein